MREPFRRASQYITLLLVLEALTGVAIIIVTGVYRTILDNYLAESEGRLLNSFVFGLYVFGCQLIVTFLCSICMWNRLWCRRCTPNIRLLLSIWLFYSCVIIISGIASLWNLYSSADVMEDVAEASLMRGIDMYYTCPEWKLLWDSLQLRNECCGVNSYKDWMNADWMPKSDTNCSTATGAVLAPYACCKRDCENCLLHYMPGDADVMAVGSNRQPFPTLTLEHINPNGCLPTFLETLCRFIHIIIALSLLALKFWILLCCLTRYILSRQNVGDGCDNVGLTDDEGRPLVVVKYPCNVRCITIGEDDLASDFVPDINYCNCEDAVDDPCPYEGA